MSAWIKMIDEDQAGPRLRELLDQARTPHGTVDTVMRVHSLRPESMHGHVTLYRSVLHCDDNTLPFLFLEIVASYTSILNDCTYSLTHHFENVRKLMKDQPRADRVFLALKAGRPEDEFEGKELALLRYAAKLTTSVGKMIRSDYEALKLAGCEDGEILEVNQVCAYFNYSNRLLNGLGATTENDVIGFYTDADES